jgi:hypothetical protein
MCTRLYGITSHLPVPWLSCSQVSTPHRSLRGELDNEPPPWTFLKCSIATECCTYDTLLLLEVVSESLADLLDVLSSGVSPHRPQSLGSEALSPAPAWSWSRCSLRGRIAQRPLLLLLLATTSIDGKAATVSDTPQSVITEQHTKGPSPTAFLLSLRNS